MNGAFMFFAYEFTAPLLVEDLTDAEVVVELGGAHSLSVSISKSPEGAGVTEKISGIARLSIDPNDKVRHTFEALADLRIPEGGCDPSDEEWHWYLDESGRLKPNVVVAAHMLPEGTRSFITQTRSELGEAIRRTLKLIRWRWRLPGSHNPFSGRKVRWSFDDSVWRPVPGDIDFDAELHVPLKVTAESRNELQRIVNDGLDEPLAQELFREAWSQRSSNPRSALLIGVAALEIGVKDLIADLLPGSEWLMENVPSPPVVRMLQEYIPTLPARLDVEGKVLPPPADSIEALKGVVNARNKLTHTGGSSLKGEKLKAALRNIGDVLWLLDYYHGHAWAKRHMGYPFRDKLWPSKSNVASTAPVDGPRRA